MQMSPHSADLARCLPQEEFRMWVLDSILQGKFAGVKRIILSKKQSLAGPCLQLKASAGGSLGNLLIPKLLLCLAKKRMRGPEVHLCVPKA